MAATGSDRGRALFSAHSALMGSNVHVYLAHDQTFVSGVLYAIDPESGDVALLQPATNAASERSVPVKIVLGHAIDRLTLDEGAGAVNLESIKQTVARQRASEEQKISHVDARELTEKLLRFLDQRFIPHAPGPSSKQDTVPVFGGAATLRFPFAADCVDCANEQILLRLQALLDDFQRECRA